MNNRKLFLFALASVAIAIVLKFLTPGWMLIVLIFNSPIIFPALVLYVLSARSWSRTNAAMPGYLKVTTLTTGIFLVLTVFFLPEFDDSSGYVWLWWRIESQSVVAVLWLVCGVSLFVAAISLLVTLIGWFASLKAIKTQRIGVTEKPLPQ